MKIFKWWSKSPEEVLSGGEAKVPQMQNKVPTLEAVRNQRGNSHNFLFPKKVNRKASFFNRSAYIISALNILCVASAGLLGYFYFRYLGDELSIYYPAGALAVFGALSFICTLGMSYGEHYSRKIGLNILFALSIIFPFYISTAYPIYFVLSALLVLVVFFVWGEQVAGHRIENGLKFKFLNSAKPRVGKIITGSIIAAIILYIPQWDQTSEIIPKKSFDKIYNVVAEFATGAYQEFDFNSDIENFAETIAIRQAEKDDDYLRLTGSQRNEYISILTDELLSSASGDLGIELSGEMTIADAIFLYVTKFINEWKERLDASLPVVWAIVLFVTFRSVGTIFGLIILILSYIIYEMLFTSGIIELRSETTTKEIVEFV